MTSIVVVVVGEPSEVGGSLSTNGDISLENPAGIAVATTAVIDARSIELIAARDRSDRLATISVDGRLTVSPGGVIELMSPHVSVAGSLVTPSGLVRVSGGGESVAALAIGPPKRFGDHLVSSLVTPALHRPRDLASIGPTSPASSTSQAGGGGTAAAS